MRSTAASLLLVVLLAGQGLSWLCVPVPPGAERAAHPSETAHAAQGPARAGYVGHADHGSHHESEERCGGVMACGLVGAVTSPLGGVDALSTADDAPAMRSSFLPQSLPTQDPPPPRFG